MKGSNILIAVIFIVLCLGGWVSIASQKVTQSNSYDNYIEQADAWMGEGLYQRAIASYKQALETNSSQELYEKIVYAYQLRYEEAPKETEEEYYDFLEVAVNTYPAHQEFVDALVEKYYIESEYLNMYNCLIKAVENGYDNESIQQKIRMARYAFQLRRAEFSGIKQSVEGMYAVSRENLWNTYSLENGYLYTSEYDFVGLVNEDGIAVVTGTDSRLIDGTGLVLGIFKQKVNEAGVYSEGLIPTCCNGVYSYYDEFANKQFGEYEKAGMFQNGLAAVKQNSEWMLVNTNGEIQSEKFTEIVLDYVGRYVKNETILTLNDNGIYCLYDTEWELKGQFECDAVDIYTQDGIIAINKGGKWGFVNSIGEIIIEPSYDNAKSFSNGLAAVCKDGLWGFIDPDNNVVIDYQFSDVGYMSASGVCPVRTDVVEKKIELKEVVATSEETKQNIEENLETWKMLELELGIITE